MSWWVESMNWRVDELNWWGENRHTATGTPRQAHSDRAVSHSLLHTFVALGNTVVVIEHNLDVIKTADYIVDMGPEGGVKGGNIIAEGKPEEIVNIKGNYTGQFLKDMLKEKFKKTA